MIDIHNHTHDSDGKGPAEEIIKNAIKNGIDTVGISDHHKGFFMDKPKREDFDSYIKKLNMLKKKYREQIKILAGIEINLNFESKIDEDRIPYRDLSKLDYVLFERIEGLSPFDYPRAYHVKFKDIGLVAEKINCKKGLAHTDLFKLSEIYSHNRGIEYGMDYVIGMMKEYNLFWELNVQEPYEYFDYIINNWESGNVVTLFNKLREQEIEIIAGSDTHCIYSDFKINRIRLANEIAVASSGKPSQAPQGCKFCISTPVDCA